MSDTDFPLLTNLLDTGEWWFERGTCGTYVAQGIDWWFTDEERVRESHDEARAKRVCRQECPVRQECLGFALANPEIAFTGIWGGMGARELRAAREGDPPTPPRTRGPRIPGAFYAGPCRSCGSPMIAGREVTELPSPDFRRQGSKRFGLCSRCKEAIRRATTRRGYRRPR